MAISNREKQQRYRESKLQAGHSRVACWLAEDDSQRLRRLMEMLSDGSERKAGYSAVISQALKELEISLTPPANKNMVRYGLKILVQGTNAPSPAD